MRLIDADAIPWFIKGEGFIPVIGKDEIDEQPTIDAVQVVRCKDCVFSKPYNEKWIQPKMLNNDRWCELYGTRHQNWYCADGERKDDAVK